MYPHERSLVKQMRDQPFVLIGVNSDADLAKLKPRLEQEQITWRSFWNGERGTHGPISTRWNVHGWPTLFLIDHRGVIRRRWSGRPGDEELDREIGQLVKAAAAAQHSEQGK